MLPSVDAMYKPSKPAAQRGVTRGNDGLRRLGPQQREHPVDASARSHSVPKRETSGDEADDLLIAGLIVAMDKIDRVTPSGRLRIATREQGVQVFADTVHFPPVLAILRS